MAHLNDTRTRYNSNLWTNNVIVAAIIAASIQWTFAEEHLNTTPEPAVIPGHTNPSEMSMTGDADYDFAINMRIHHQMAVEMAKAEVAHGKNTEMVNLAKGIIAAQTEEISILNKWIAHQTHPETPKPE